MAVELATAYVNIVPSTRDLAGGIVNDLVPGAQSAGNTAGAAAGTGMLVGMKKFLGPAVVAGATAGVAKGLYEIGSTFDNVADTIRVGTGATGDVLDGLVASAKNVGRNVPADFASIAPVIADLNTRLGLSGETLEGVASQYLEAGRILGEEVDIGSTTAAFSAFGIEGEGVSAAMDALFTASQATGVGMNELASSAQQAAPALQSLGFGFEDSIALVGQFDKAGLNSTQVMSGMSRGLVNLAKDGEQPQDAFKRVVGEIDGFVAAGDEAAALDLASKVFGTRGAPQFMAAISSGILSVDDLTAAIGASSDTILGVGGETADFAESWQVVKNNALLALEPLGSAVFTGLGDIFAGMVEPMQTVSAWLGENTWAFGVLAAVVGGVVVAAFVAWAAALLANPVTWIVVGIVALVAALVALVANWDAVVAWISGVWAAAVQWVKDSFASIGSWFSTKGEAIASYLTGLWDGIKATATRLWDNIINWIKGVPGKIMSGLNELGQLGSKFSGWVQAAKDSAVEKFNSLVDWVKDVPSKIVSAIGDLGNLLKSAGRSIITGLWNGLKEKWESVKTWVSGIGDWIADHKGPKAYDLALLVPAGGWIMQGLERGLERGIPGLRDTLGDVAQTVASTRFGVGVDSYADFNRASGSSGTVRLDDQSVRAVANAILAGATTVSLRASSQVLAGEMAGVSRVKRARGVI